MKNFYCFLCGHELNELGLGVLECTECKNQFIPFVDKDGFQCLMSGNEMEAKQ